MSLRRPLLLLWALLLALAPLATLAQTPPAAIELVVLSPYGQFYQPYQWLPLNATLVNNGPDTQVELRVGRMATRVDLPGGSRKEVTLYVRPIPQPRLVVEAYAGGQVAASATLRLLSASKPLAAVVGELSTRPNTIELIPLEPGLLPSRAAGYGPLAGLVLDGRERITLSPEQIQAIEAWVGAGNTLLITGGDAADALLAQFPEHMRPADAVTNEPAQLDQSDFAALAGQSDVPDPASAIRLLPHDQAQVQASADGRPLSVVRTIGNGRIVALAIALDAPAFTTWSGSPALWQQLVPPRYQVPTFDPSMSPEQMRDQSAMGTLSTLPALERPPLGWLLTLLAIYLVLVGPVSHFVLRRLDRMAWAWVTIPVLTLAFAALTFGIGSRQRGSDIILNHATIVEQRSGETVQVTTYAGLFSPMRRSYTIQGTSGMLLRPLDQTPWSGPMTNNSALFVQDRGVAEGLLVNQWSLEVVAAEQALAWGGLRADLRLEGNTLSGTVTNDGDQPVRDLVLLFGSGTFPLGTLEPGASTEVNQDIGVLVPSQGEPMSSRVFGLNPDYAALQQRMSLVDLAVPPMMNQSMRPLLIGWLDRSPGGELNVTDAEKPHIRQNVILISNPSLQFGSGAVTLTPGMLETVDPNQRNAPACWSMTGPGLTIQQRTLEVQVTVPQQARDLQLSGLIINPTFDGPPVGDKTTVRAMNWETGQMEVIMDKLKRHEIADPARFLSPSGELRMQVELPQEVDLLGGIWGCFSPNVELSGVLP